MITENRIQRAREFAIEKHINQKYGDEPYSFHLTGVAKYAKEMSDKVTSCIHYREAIVIVAWLHDIVEDNEYTEVSIDEIYDMFGYFVGEAVKALSHDKEQTYAEYLKMVGKNDIATVVKLADLKFNMEQSRKSLKEKKNGYVKQRLAKYEVAELYLNKVRTVF